MRLSATPLRAFVAPASIVIVGPCHEPASIGQALLHNLRAGQFSGRIELVCREAGMVDGIACYREVAELPLPASLALIATPAAEVPEAVAACAARGIAAAIVYSGGLRSADPDGARHLGRLRSVLAEQRIRIMGPRALGLLLPHAGLNLTPARVNVTPGNLAFVSQSASVCANVLDWSHGDGFGLSAVFVPGAAEDVGMTEILDHLATDPATECILLYLEGLHDARGFLSAVRAAAAVKPVIALKAGQAPESARIAEAHCGVPVGSDDAFDAALRRVGVLRVRSVGDMFSAARALTSRKKPRGNRLAIVANGGGPAVMAVDQAAQLGIALAELTPASCQRLAAIHHADWSGGNPVDIMFDAGPERYAEAIGACLADPGVDGVLAIFAPNDRVDPEAVAVAVSKAAATADKPVLACWLGEVSVRAARTQLAQQRFPVFRTPENAIVAFAFMVNWMRNQALLLETPPALSSYTPPDTDAARMLIDAALGAGRQRLTLPETKAILAAFQIPVSQTQSAASPGEALAAAERIGYPVAMKAAAGGGGGTRAHLRSPPEVALAWREISRQAGAAEVLVEPHIERPRGRWLSVAIRPDAVFGPVITLSESGIAPEIYDARSLALPPLNPRLVHEMLRVPHVARLLGRLRDLPAVAEGPLREVLLRVSELASELPWIHALNIAALVADDREALVVDAEIELQPLAAAASRYAHMAICPYPAQLETEWTLKDGQRYTVRPVRPEDASLLQDFVRGLSMHSRRLRFLSTLAELPQHSLARHTQIDYGRQLTLVVTGEREGRTLLLGEAQYSTLIDGVSGDFAIVVADAMAGLGLGRRLMQAIIVAAAAQGLKRLRGDVRADNDAMLGMMEALGFDVRWTDDPDVVEVELRL